MSYLRTSHWVWMGALVSLAAACAGQVRNLGNESGAAGMSVAGQPFGGNHSAGTSPAGIAGDQWVQAGGGALSSDPNASNSGGGVGGQDSTTTGSSVQAGQWGATGGNAQTAQGGATGGNTQTAQGGATGGYGQTAQGGATGGYGQTAQGGTTEARGGQKSYWGNAGGFNVSNPPPLGGAVDPQCQCSTAGELCGNGGVCTNACSPEGRCAVWLTNRAVRGLYHAGTTLYFATARSADVLGNPGPLDGSLYKVGETDAVPTLVASGLPDPVRILGRYQSSTFIGAQDPTVYSIYEVTDVGVVTRVTLADSPVMALQGKWLISTYYDNQLQTINLDAGRTPPEGFAWIGTPNSGGSSPGKIIDAAVLGAVALYRIEQPTGAGSGSITCRVTLPSDGTSNSCSIASFSNVEGGMLASTETNVYFGGGKNPSVRAYDSNGTPHLLVYDVTGADNPWSAGTAINAVIANGWAYSAFDLAVAQSSMYPSLFPGITRYPTTVGRLPQQLIPFGFGTTLFAPSQTRLYYAYRVDRANSAQYIFQMPLPAQPCDEQLPCADASKLCVNGSCT